MKRCIAINCKKYFPSKLGDYIPYCPECYLYEKSNMVEKFKSTRNIPIYYFDVFDSDYPLNNFGIFKYERVCRICGSRLLKKDGTYIQQRRFCKKHSGDTSFLTRYLWSFVRDTYIVNLKRKHRIEIILTAMDQGKEVKIREYKGIILLRYYICEKCRKIITYNAIEVHHKIPVHKLTEENFFLIWDVSNLICFCLDCHSKIDHKLKWSSERKKKAKEDFLKFKYRNYTKISDFMKEMN